MNSEVNGIDVEEALIQRYAGLNRKEAENLALEVSVEIGKEIADSAESWKRFGTDMSFPRQL